MKKRVNLIWMILLPILAFAQGIGNAMAIWGIICLILIFIGVIGLCSVYFYLKNGSTLTFYLSGITALVGLFATISYTEMYDPAGIDLDNKYALPFLLILGLLLYRKHNDNPRQIIWYFLLNVVSVLLVTVLLLQFMRPSSPVFYLNYGFYLLYAILYVRRTVQAEPNIESQSVFLNTNLICFLSFATLTIFDLLRFNTMDEIGQGFILNFNHIYLKEFIIVLVITNLSTVGALKTYR